MEFGKLGTTTDAQGNSQYLGWRNPLLQPMVLSLPTGTPMNPMTFATQLAAARLAQVLGGEVVPDPMVRTWNITGKAWSVQLPGKDPVNAGYIFNVLGNDIAYSNARSKSWNICELLGLDFDPGIADKIFAAIEPEIK